MTIDNHSPKELWRHDKPELTHLYRFKEHVSRKFNVQFGSELSPDSLYQWSIENVANFWAEVWDYTGIRCSKTYDTVVDESAPIFPRPSFFKGAKLNFAENLLFPSSITNEHEIAVIAATEISRERITWKELRERVRVCRAALKSVGVKPGDRIAGYVGNHANTLVAVLAASSLGCIWTAQSPDVGVTAFLERMRQISPTVLFADNAVIYNGKTHDNMEKVAQAVQQLESLKSVVVFHNIEHPSSVGKIITKSGNKALLFKDFLSLAPEDAKLEFEQLDADHPLYILYSSGTTGAPKCIVHGAIGTLIQHKKEHQLHSDIGPGDVFFQFTTVAWMMFHFNISALASGATILLYDGSPFRPLIEGCGDMAMPALMEELGVSCFGTSAKYLSILEQNNCMPKSRYGLSKLRAIYSTGSVLAPSTFEYVYRAFGPNINLGSITGGTDIISLFGAPNPLVPVYSGEIQCRGLGMAVEAWDIDGKAVYDAPGDLVCKKVFPCMPIMFWGPGGDEKYQKSYFEQFPGVWCHGDFVQINSNTGSMLMLGRSDGVLKPAGVRFGSAEIYNVILSKFADEIEDSLCIGRRRPTDVDESVILFLKVARGHTYTPELVARVKDTIRKELSGRHVPTIIDETKEIPVTVNGKKIEVAVKQIISMMSIKISASVANPECLEFYRNWATIH